MAISTTTSTRYRLRVNVTAETGEQEFLGSWKQYEYEVLERRRGPFGNLTGDVLKWIDRLGSVTGRSPGKIRARVEIESETETVSTVTNTSQALVSEHEATRVKPLFDEHWQEVEQ